MARRKGTANNGCLMNIVQIAAHMGISKSMVHYLERSALAKFRAAMMAGPNDLDPLEREWIERVAAGLDPHALWTSNRRKPVWNLRVMGLINARGTRLTRRGEEMAAQLLGVNAS